MLTCSLLPMSDAASGVRGARRPALRGLRLGSEHKKRWTHYDADENPKRAQYRLLRDLTMHMEKYARKQKAARLGYSPDDEAFYSKPSWGCSCRPSFTRITTSRRANPMGAVRTTLPNRGHGWRTAPIVAPGTEATPLSEKEREAIILTSGARNVPA
jgi:hypothetical protein